MIDIVRYCAFDEFSEGFPIFSNKHLIHGDRWLYVGNRICVSLGTNDMNQLKRLVNDAFTTNTDFIEVRADYFDKSTIDEVLDVIMDHKERVVFTCRPTTEGGRYNGTEAERMATLRRAASFRPMLLDVEYRTMTANEHLKDQFGALNCDTLVSWHDFNQTPTAEELGALLDRMKTYSNNVKIVTMAKSADDNSKVLKLYENAKRANVNLITFCMGESGVLSRVLCTYTGAPFTYASLTDTVAPGQLSIKQMRAIYTKLEKEIPALNDYSTWKDRQGFDDVMRIINEVRIA